MPLENRFQGEVARTRVRKVLLDEWDPIGIRNIPECVDEYDSYVDQVLAIATSKLPDGGLIADHLMIIVTEVMKIQDGPELRARSRHVAELLIGSPLPLP